MLACWRAGVRTCGRAQVIQPGQHTYGLLNEFSLSPPSSGSLAAAIAAIAENISLMLCCNSGFIAILFFLVVFGVESAFDFAVYSAIRFFFSDTTGAPPHRGLAMGFLVFGFFGFGFGGGVGATSWIALDLYVVCSFTFSFSSDACSSRSVSAICSADMSSVRCVIVRARVRVPSNRIRRVPRNGVRPSPVGGAGVDNREAFDSAVPSLLGGAVPLLIELAAELLELIGRVATSGRDSSVRDSVCDSVCNSAVP